jgi:hypothetical protein
MSVKPNALLRAPVGIAAIAAITALSSAAPARADGTKRACVAASSEGQALRDAAKLLEAHGRFVACARDECPAVVRKYCLEWLADVERRQPTVIFRAQTAEGSDMTGAQISIDGTLEPHALGTPIPLNPGEHTVHAEHAGMNPVDIRVAIIDGEKGRVVPIRFAPIAVAAPLAPVVVARPETARGVSPLTVIFAGLGVVGVGGFAGFGLKAQSDLSNLRETCAPYCSSSALDSVKREALVADISLGVGVVALGVAAYTLFARHDPPAIEKGATIDVRPVAGGALAQVGARF